MHCPNCNHPANGVNFCEKCGVRLHPIKPAAMNSREAINPTPTPQQTPSSIQLEKAKVISKNYLGFFLSVLKKPYAVSKKVGEEQFINGLITIILFAIAIPLMVYMGMGDYRAWIESPFMNIILIPTIAYVVFLLLVATYSFVAIKLGKIDVSYKTVIARFGTFLVPFVAIFILALVLAILQFEIFLFVLSFGFFTAITTVTPFLISSFKGDNQNGLDTVYGTLIVYVLIFITFVIMGEALFSMLENIIARQIGSFFFW